MGFTGRDQRVWLDVPRPDPKATAPTRGDDFVAAPWANVQVILEHDRLPVQHEPPTLILSEEVEHPVNRVNQPPAEALKHPIPLAVPMRVRHQHAPKILASIH